MAKIKNQNVMLKFNIIYTKPIQKKTDIFSDETLDNERIKNNKIQINLMIPLMN